MDDSEIYLPTSDPWSHISQEDKAILTGLPLPELQRRTREKIGWHRSYMIALSIIHNAVIPIHAKLPPEVLINIFVMVPTKNSMLMLVCRRWRDLLLGTSEYWANILAVIRYEYHKYDDFIVNALQRSYPHRLVLNGDVKPILWPQFTPHLDRVTSLCVEVLQVSDCQRLFRLFTRRELPVLESLEFKVYTDGASLGRQMFQTDQLMCTDEHFPNLRHLVIPGQLFAFLFSISRLLTLTLCRLLDLDSEYFHVAGYTQKLVRAVRQCTDLRVLRAKSLPQKDWAGLEKPETKSSPFLHLRVIEGIVPQGTWFMANVLQDLVRHIVPQPSTRLHITTRTVRVGNPLSIIIPARPPVPILGSNRKVHVVIADVGASTLKAFLDDLELLEVKFTPQKRIPEPVASLLAQWLQFLMGTSMVSIQGVDSLEFAYGSGRSKIFTWRDLRVLLDFLPSLRFIALHAWLPSDFNGDGPEAQKDLLRALCNEPQAEGDIPCPALKELKIICVAPAPSPKTLAARIGAVLSARHSGSASRLDIFSLHGYPNSETTAASREEDVREELLKHVKPFVNTIQLVRDSESGREMDEIV